MWTTLLRYVENWLNEKFVNYLVYLTGRLSHLVVTANYRGLSADLLRHNSLLLSGRAVGCRLCYRRLLNLQNNTSIDSFFVTCGWG